MNRIRKNLAGRNRDRGFSLLEVLIAMSIMSVGLLALAQMQVAAMKANRSTTVRTDAVTVGQEAMERVINSPFGDLGDLGGSEVVERNKVQYTVNTTIGSGITGLAQSAEVTVVVSWNDGRAHAFTLRTVKTFAEDPT